MIEEAVGHRLATGSGTPKGYGAERMVQSSCSEGEVIGLRKLLYVVQMARIVLVQRYSTRQIHLQTGQRSFVCSIMSRYRVMFFPRQQTQLGAMHVSTTWEGPKRISVPRSPPSKNFALHHLNHLKWD